MEDGKGARIRTREVLSSTDSESSFSSPKPKQLKMADKEITIDVLYKILMEMKENLSTLLNDNRALKKDLDDVKVSLSMQESINDQLKKENENLKSKAKDLQRSQEGYDAQLRVLFEKTEQLENRGDDLEMYTRKSSLEIHGVPEKIHEDLEDVVIKVAENAGVEIEEEDIDIVHRLPFKLKGIRPILVKFISHKVKSQLYFARHKLKRAVWKSELLEDADQVYINENLTTSKRKLFAETRKKARQNKWYSVWTVDGKIFVSKEKGDRSIKISCYSDLENIFV